MMALDDCFLFPFQPSLDWDLQTFELGDHHEFMPLATEDPMSSTEASTGYLQDAVAAWSDRCKRRRMTSNSDDDPISMTKDLQDLLQGFWDSNCYADPLDDLNYMLQDNSTVLEDPPSSSMPMTGPSTQDAIASQHQQEPLSSLSSQEEPLRTDTGWKATKESRDTKASPHPSLRVIKSFSPKETESWRGKKKKEAMGVVYPFAVVKPGGLEGDVTLDDINARILMRPARPVHHPVGDFAGGPCVSADGPGLSGKAVASLTRIHTKGRGTITIIRTRG
ncbi:uncharacterized protein LOC103706774 [Phoenix dactylifera]|uniref:Uncharacterized protein LOC103706774 n=1 Tax=Phoenix dactylifera TaxID=42345 RepID=A0A8B7C0Q1_PHODC|nr:uncharacterized protein LOC103706774 [Phoenix dactylifera]